MREGAVRTSWRGGTSRAGSLLEVVVERRGGREGGDALERSTGGMRKKRRKGRRVGERGASPVAARVFYCEVLE